MRAQSASIAAYVWVCVCACACAGSPPAPDRAASADERAPSADGHAPERSAAATARAPHAPRPLAHLALRFELPEHVSPTVVADTVAAIDRGDPTSLVLYDAETGARRATVREALGRQHANAHHVGADGLLLLTRCPDEACELAELVALRTTGEIVWSQRLPMPAVALRTLDTPSGAEVIAELGPRRIYHRNAFVRRIVAWDPATGRERWALDLPDDRVQARYAEHIDTERILLAARTGLGTGDERAFVHTIDRRTGARGPSHPLPFYGWIHADAHRIVVHAGGAIAMLDRVTGAPLALPEIGGHVRHAFLATGSLYLLVVSDVAAEEGRLVALDATTGAERWTFAHPARSVAAASDALFVLSASRIVHAVDPRTGTSRARFGVPDANVVGALPGLAGGDGVAVSARDRAVIFGRGEASGAARAPIAGVVRGTVRLGGRPARHVPVRANDREARTDARGRYELPLDVHGGILVGIVGGYAGLDPLLPDHKCVEPYAPAEQILTTGAGSHVVDFTFTAGPCR